MYRELGVSRLIGVIAGFFTEFLRTIEKKECSKSEKTRRRLFTSLSPNLFKAATYRDLVLGQHWHPRLLDLLGTLKRFHERQMDFEL